MLTLTVLSPERKLVDGLQIQSLMVTGSEGLIQILPEHAEMIGTIETGPFSYSPVSGEAVAGVISTGFFEIKGHQVIVMAETCELSKEIDVSRAKVAQKKAESALSDPELDNKLFRKYELKLQRSLIRQQIAGKTTLH